MKSAFYSSDNTDPYRNLAIEEYLLQQAQDRVILYLWQNENTVVIGKNQNPWKECNTALLEQEGGHLARRLSGGGAVFHDLGNLNFTFLMPQKEFDLQRQFSVIVRGLQSLGIPAECTGRNDLTVHGRKFSGNAFYKNGKAAYHHGTLLVDADLEKLGRYLSPSKAKLAAKGVDSVRSRVINLRQLQPVLELDALKQAFLEEFAQEYGQPEAVLLQEDPKLAEMIARYESWQWNYGQRLPFTAQCEAQFSWGGISLELQVDAGVIQGVKVWSDAMDWQYPALLEQQLTGCRFTLEDMKLRLGTLEHGQELRVLAEQLF